MAALIYSLCAFACVVSAALLLRSYFQTGYRLLLWAGLCFVGLTASNVLLVLDRIVYPTADLSTPRLATAFIGLLLLLYGLIWEND